MWNARAGSAEIMNQEQALSVMFERSTDLDSAPGSDPSPRVRVEEAGVRVVAALEALGERPDASRGAELISRCIEYGAAALAAARGLFEGEELLAQVRPSEDRLAQLIAEEEPEPEWLRSRAPAADWKAAFRANQTAITAPDVPTAALFDRLTVGVGLAADLCAWLDGPIVAASGAL